MKFVLVILPFYVVLNMFAAVDTLRDSEPCEKMRSISDVISSRSENNFERFVIKPISLSLYPGMYFGEEINHAKYCGGK